MKKINALIALPLIAAVLLFGSFTVKPETHGTKAAIINYAWYTPDNEFIAWSTLANAEVVTGGDTNPNNGTLVAEGWTGGGAGLPPSGTLVYKLYTHP